MNNKNQKAKFQFIFFTLIILGAVSIILGVSFAFGALSIDSSKKHMIKAADMDVVLKEESDGIRLIDAMPVYDEVGMIGNPYKFQIVNQGGIPTSYLLKLVDTKQEGNKLALTDVKLGLIKNGKEVMEPKLLSTIFQSEYFEGGIVSANETINYELRLWIRNDIVDLNAIADKGLSYKLEVKATDDKLAKLSSAKSGSYVEYSGNNGCNGNSCNGISNTSCSSALNGWRIAYKDNNHAYLISAGNIECLNIKTNTAKTQLDNIKNASRKYCNKLYVDNNCNESDVWTSIRSTVDSMKSQASTDVVNGGGNYWLAESQTVGASYNEYLIWYNVSRNSYAYHEGTGPHNWGIRPVIRLSSEIHIISGEGTVSSPYIIRRIKSQ